jgi:hypothetical protein
MNLKTLTFAAVALACAAPAYATEWWQITYPANSDSHSDEGAQCEVANSDPAAVPQSHKAIGDWAEIQKKEGAEVDVNFAADMNSEMYYLRFSATHCREEAAPRAVRELRQGERRWKHDAEMIATIEQSHTVMRLECDQNLIEAAPDMTADEVKKMNATRRKRGPAFRDDGWMYNQFVGPPSTEDQLMVGAVDGEASDLV